MGMLISINNLFLMLTMETTILLLLLLLLAVISFFLLYRNRKLARENDQYKVKLEGEQILNETVKERLFSIDILDNLPFPVLIKNSNKYICNNHCYTL